MLSSSRGSSASASDRIGNLFLVYGNSDYIGEDVSILEHSWQAFECSSQEHEDVRMACLLHDVGHMLGMEAGFPIGMNGCGVPDHEVIGGDFLRSLGFPERVAWLVANHVNAKRFLVWQNPNYQLSSASQTTLTFQGGPMTDEEAHNFMKVDGYESVIDMRKYDEAAKVPSLPNPSISHIKTVIREYLDKAAPKASPIPAYRLSSEQKRFFQEQGYLVVKGAGFTDPTKLSDMTDALSAVAESNNASPHLLVHHEQVMNQSESKIQLCRVENFVKHEESWSEVEAFVRGIVSELFDEPAVLFKDKLNFKLPGGGGFLAHQDVTAYKSNEFAKLHISVLVAVDAALSSQVGPLQFAGGRHAEGIFPNSKGVIDPAVENTLDFKELLVEAGDLVFFDSYVPHRSGTNLSDNPRRLAYLTYNKSSEGDFNEVYYAAKLNVFAKGTGGPISINDDFAGTIVPIAS